MTKTRWTPGPWEWHCAKHEDGRNNGSVIADAKSGRARCVCKAPQYEKDEQWQANAHLIAAAPLMYEALQPFAAFIDAFDRKPINGLDDDIYTIHAGTEWEAKLTRTQMRAARAALRTARGETREQSV